jgi:hypothetical protein
MRIHTCGNNEKITTTTDCATSTLLYLNGAKQLRLVQRQLTGELHRMSVLELQPAGHILWDVWTRRFVSEDDGLLLDICLGFAECTLQL